MATVSPEFQSIADALLKQIDDFQPSVGKQSVGTVRAVYDGIAIATGLADVKASEIVEFASGQAGVALNLEPDSVGIVVMGDYAEIETGDEVRTTGRIASVPVGDALIGRVVDTITAWARGQQYFASEDDLSAFSDDLKERFRSAIADFKASWVGNQ